jgi:hypothetical protein
MRADICRVVLVALAMGLAAGCSGVKTYPNTLDKNLQIRSETVAGPALFRVRTALSVYRVDERCELELEGVVKIDQPTVSVGIPAGRWSYLDFTFSDPSLAGGSSGSVSRETLFRPRAGYRYDIAVSYRKDVYHVAIREIPTRGGPGREIEFRDIRACRPPWRAAASGS